MIDLAHKAFCHVLAAHDREDLNKRLMLLWQHVSTVLFPSPDESDDEDDHQFMLEDAYFKYVLGESNDEEVEMPENLSVAAQYMEYLLATRFAPPRHPAYLEDDYRAKSHAQYGMHSVAMASYFNMNCESIIKTLFVTELNRRAFPAVSPFVSYVTGYSIDGRPLPKSVPHIVKIRKERNARSKEARFSVNDKYELAAALTTLIMGGVHATENPLVINVDHTKAWMRTMTDDPAMIRVGWSQVQRTRDCLAHFDIQIDSFFDGLVPATTTRERETVRLCSGATHR